MARAQQLTAAAEISQGGNAMSRWLTLGAILCIAVATPPLLVGKGDPEAGKAVFAKKCASCHGTAGEGKEAIAKMMKVELRHLGSKEAQAKSDDDIRKVIVEGTEKKKPVKGLSDADLDNLIAFVRSLKQK
jgi:mono/diheme cytochrome c family protein